MNPIRRRLRNAPINGIRRWARRPDLEKSARVIPRLRSRRQGSNVKAALRVYDELEKEGYFNELRRERSDPDIRKVVGEPRLVRVKTERKIEHFMELASLASEIQRQHLTPIERAQKIAKMDALLSEMNTFFMNERELQRLREFKHTEFFYIAPLIAASQALQEIGINTKLPNGKKIQRGVLQELFRVSNDSLQHRIESYLKGKAKKFIARKSEIANQLEREFNQS